jgi:hypothetical protein
MHFLAPDGAVGPNNRLFVYDWSTGIYQIDATTGVTTGPGMSWLSGFGNLQMSPDPRTLYPPVA